jgi:DNA-binding response OmpR family regulator
MSRVICAVSENRGVKSGKEPASAPGKAPQAAGKFPLHVLVVDDEPLIRWSVSESLASHGYVVEEAPDAASALRNVMTTALAFNAIVLDLRLPDMTDLSLLATLRQLVPDVHVILMTAFGSPELLAQAQSLGADVITKPFELDELNRLIRAKGPATRY